MDNNRIKFLEGYIPFLETQIKTLRMFEEFNQSMFKYDKISWEVAQQNGIEYFQGIQAGEQAISMAKETIASLKAAEKPWGDIDENELVKAMMSAKKNSRIPSINSLRLPEGPQNGRRWHFN